MEQWLQTSIQFEKDYHIQDIVNTLADKTWNWIHSQEDLIIQQDYNSFKQEFINFIYTKYHLQ
jgi:hypothetical protein